MSENRPQHEMNDQELDSLLAEACWLAPTPQSEKRLETLWLSHHRQQWVTRWAMAAAVLLATSAGVSVYLSQPVGNSSSVAHRQLRAGIQARTPSMSEADGNLIASRPPSRMELAMLSVAEKESDRKASQTPARSAAPAPRDARVELLERMRTGNLSQRRAAAMTFASSAKPEDIPYLLEMDQIPELRDCAVAGLARVAQLASLIALTRKHSDMLQQRILIAALLRWPEGQTVREYLELVVDSSTRRAALAALDDVPGVSTDAFFAALNDPHVSVREAAARVLGHIDGPQTTARLVAMAAQNCDRREALMALADSRGGEARKFLQEASIAGPLAGTVRSVLLEHRSPN